MKNIIRFFKIILPVGKLPAPSFCFNGLDCKKIVKIFSLVFLLINMFSATEILADDGTGSSIIHASHEQTQMFGGSEVANLNPELRKDASLGIGEVYEELEKKKCLPSYKMRTYDTSDCTLCPIIRAVFNTVSQIAATASVNFSKPVAKVVAVAFAMWLAFYLLKYLASMEAKDIKDVFQEVVFKGGQVVLVIMILNGGASNFYKWLINPVYETALAGGSAALGSCSSGDCSKNTSIKVSNAEGVQNIKDGLPVSMGTAIINAMVNMENNISEIRAFGSSLMCYSWDKGWFIFPKWSLLISGLLFWVMAMLMIFIVPLLMVDVVFELGVAVALLPPAIGCFPFRYTRKNCNKVWDTFLNSAFAFLFVSIVLVMILTVLKQEAEFLASDSGMTWAQIMSDDVGKMDDYIDNFGWTKSAVLKFVFIILLIWSVMNMGKDFADEFASSISSTSIGSSIGTMAASAAKGAAKKVGAGAVSGGKALVQNMKQSHLGQKLGNTKLGQGVKSVAHKVGNTKFGRGVKKVNNGVKEAANWVGNSWVGRAYKHARMDPAEYKAQKAAGKAAKNKE